MKAEGFKIESISLLSEQCSQSFLQAAKLILLFLFAFFILVPKASAQYTLTDDDVVVIDGIIDDCSYNYSITDIIIPDTLDGQIVRGVADKSYNNGVFQFRGLTSVVFPSSIESIGHYAFTDNKLIHIDLSECSELRSIRFNAFHGNNLISLDLSACTSLGGISDNAFDNNDLEDIDFSGCIALVYIGFHSFSSNKLTNLDLSACGSLEHIEEYAFSSNSLTHLNLSGCSALKIIGEMAFRSNNLTELDLSGCTSLWRIQTDAFSGNMSLGSFSLPINSEYGALGWMDGYGNRREGGESVNPGTNYYIPISYTLIDNDVEVFDGIINSSNQYSIMPNTDIVIPDTLDGQKVRGIADKRRGSGVFQYERLTSVKITAAIESIGDYAFYANLLIDLDINACSSLVSIGACAFKAGRLKDIDLSGCSSLIYIGAGAFENNILEKIKLPTPKIPGYRFRHWMDGDSIIIPGGDSITNFTTSYNAIFWDSYTLTDKDVLVIDGIIDTCSYDFKISNIIIPDSLDGQAVIGIADKIYPEGVFRGKGITAIELPSNIEFIGDYAFYGNILKEIDLSNFKILSSIGVGAFENNDFSGFILPTPEIPGLNFSHWFDEDSITFAGGDTINNLNSAYLASFVSTYTVSLFISDGVLPIYGAEVSLAGYGSLQTDSAGEVVFSGVFPAENLSFTVNANGFYEANGTISIEDDNEYINVALTLITGLYDKSGSEFSLYPNPAHDLLYIFTKEPGVLRILDVSGQLVLSRDLSEGLEEISVAQLNPGVYFFKLHKGNDTFLRKVIVK